MSDSSRDNPFSVVEIWAADQRQRGIDTPVVEFNGDRHYFEPSHSTEAAR
jgi:hypothetical protein